MSVTVASVANALPVIFVGVFVAADPGLYRDGAPRLVPPARRPRAAEIVARCAATLRRWLLGQLVAMASVGVPVVGALVGGVLAVTLAFVEGPGQAPAAFALYLEDALGEAPAAPLPVGAGTRA